MTAPSTVAEELAALVQRVANAQQLANMGDYDWHIPTDTNTWSDQMFRIYGYEPGEIDPSYDAFLAHVHPDDRDVVKATHDRAYATGEGWRIVERIVRRDGEVRHLSTNGQVVVDADGTPVRMRGTCVDITDRVVAEQAHARAQARRQQAVEINDNVVQGLTAALYALELEDLPRCTAYLTQTLEAARRMMGDLVDPQDPLVRTTPADLD